MITGVGILMPRRYLAHIKDYVLHNSKLFNKVGGELTESTIIDDSITASKSHDDIYYDYFKKESLSILKYLHSLKLNPTVTTSQGDIMVLARSRYIVLISCLRTVMMPYNYWQTDIFCMLVIATQRYPRKVSKMIQKAKHCKTTRIGMLMIILN
jgi:hypothetical protein